MTERSHLVRMHVKNIGCIGNDGLTIELDEIVCLVGANNAGKSTVLRAYERAVRGEALTPDDFNQHAKENPASVELWVHIPEAAANVDEKWKEAKDGLLLVRSKWEWSCTGGKQPIRTTWNPLANDGIGEYAEDGKASGLDSVFNSRLPQPFRIRSLDNPNAEHKKLLALVLEPIARKYKSFMDDKASDLSQKIAALQAEADKPVMEFNEHLENIQTQVNLSYQQIFNSAQIRLNISVGDIGFDPQKNLADASRVDIAEQNDQTRWEQQGTGSQRALFWSMLQVRSELNRQSDIRKNQAELAKLEQKVKPTKADQTKISNLKAKTTSGGGVTESEFLPGYMLLIDEPETALHPAAVRAAKDHLYALAAEAGWQVMLSTHHPAFIDPLKDHTTIVRLHRLEAHLPPNVYRSESMKFEGEKVEKLKALLAFDANVTEIFFGGKILIVEGDTEFATFHEAMRFDKDNYPVAQHPLIVRARGKDAIIILVKMLTHFKINFAVLHDIDSPKTKDGAKNSSAYSANKRITDAIAIARNQGIQVVHRCSCPNFEQHHSMDLPSKDKPYASWKAVCENAEIRESVLNVLNSLLPPTSQPDESEKDGANYENLLKAWVQTNNVNDVAFQFD